MWSGANASLLSNACMQPSLCPALLRAPGKLCVSLVLCQPLPHTPLLPRTPDGFERTIATNYLGHFLLAHLLLPELQGGLRTNFIERCLSWLLLRLPYDCAACPAGLMPVLLVA